MTISTGDHAVDELLRECTIELNAAPRKIFSERVAQICLEHNTQASDTRERHEAAINIVKTLLGVSDGDLTAETSATALAALTETDNDRRDAATASHMAVDAVHRPSLIVKLPIRIGDDGDLSSDHPPAKRRKIGGTLTKKDGTPDHPATRSSERQSNSSEARELAKTEILADAGVIALIEPPAWYAKRPVAIIQITKNLSLADMWRIMQRYLSNSTGAKGTSKIPDLLFNLVTFIATINGRRPSRAIHAVDQIMESVRTAQKAKHLPAHLASLAARYDMTGNALERTRGWQDIMYARLKLLFEDGATEARKSRLGSCTISLAHSLSLLLDLLDEENSAFSQPIFDAYVETLNIALDWGRKPTQDPLRTVTKANIASGLTYLLAREDAWDKGEVNGDVRIDDEIYHSKQLKIAVVFQALRRAWTTDSWLPLIPSLSLSKEDWQEIDPWHLDVVLQTIVAADPSFRNIFDNLGVSSEKDLAEDMDVDEATAGDGAAQPARRPVVPPSEDDVPE